VTARGCSHIAGVQTVTPSALGREECLKSGSQWLHLRIAAPAATSAAATIHPTSTRLRISTRPAIR